MRDLEFGQAVQVDRGALAGLVGKFVGFRGEKCLIELDVIPLETKVLIDSSAVRAICPIATPLPQVRPSCQIPSHTR